jgi:hypothetical protein
VRAIIVSVLFFLGLFSGAVSAQSTTYTYTGNPFTTFSGFACPSVCKISGSFTVAAPLPANLAITTNNVSATSLSFTDGSNVASGALQISIGTNADGNINTWEGDARGGPGPQALDFRNWGYSFDETYPACCGGPPYAETESAGTWTTDIPATGQQFWTLETSAASTLAFSETNSTGYGSTLNCTVSVPCPQPLIITFDTLNGVQAHLGGTSAGSDVLTETNSVDSSDSGVTSLVLGNWCSASTTLGLAINNEDGINYNLSSVASNAPCAGLTMNGTLVSTVPEQNATLTYFPNPSGDYTGTFGSAAPATLLLTVNSDFSVTANAFLPAGSLCAAQTTALILSTSNPEAINDAWENIPGYVTGSDVLLSLADSNGNVTWMSATDTNANGVQLAPGALFFTGYTISGVCNGTYYFDAPLHKNGTKVTPIRRHHPEHRPWHHRLRELIDAAQERNDLKIQQYGDFRFILPVIW